MKTKWFYEDETMDTNKSTNKLQMKAPSGFLILSWFAGFTTLPLVSVFVMGLLTIEIAQAFGIPYGTSVNLAYALGAISGLAIGAVWLIKMGPVISSSDDTPEYFFEDDYTNPTSGSPMNGALDSQGFMRHEPTWSWPDDDDGFGR